MLYNMWERKSLRGVVGVWLVRTVFELGVRAECVMELLFTTVMT